MNSYRRCEEEEEKDLELKNLKLYLENKSIIEENEKLRRKACLLHQENLALMNEFQKKFPHWERSSSTLISSSQTLISHENKWYTLSFSLFVLSSSCFRIMLLPYRRIRINKLPGIIVVINSWSKMKTWTFFVMLMGCYKQNIDTSGALWWMSLFRPNRIYPFKA